MAKRTVLKKGEFFIKAFKDINALDSQKKRKANFYISNKRVVLRNASDRRAILFSEINLDEIDAVKQKIIFRFRLPYVFASLLLTAFMALSYFRPETGSLSYLIFPIIFFTALLGLFSKAEHTFVLFLTAFG
ncbi:MAG: hypothetical protein LBQ40_05240, partial [Clostridiales bacterium]|nr:hypothetical protein [Clostridiales bacterium]